MDGSEGSNGGNKWTLTKEKILFFSGLAVILYEMVTAIAVPAAFHYEFILGGLALCGISITQWGDKK